MTFIGVIWVIWLVGIVMILVGALIWISVGQPLQRTYRETLIKHCADQHEALMNGDDRYGVHGNYPPVNLHIDLKLKH